MWYTFSTVPDTFSYVSSYSTHAKAEELTVRCGYTSYTKYFMVGGGSQVGESFSVAMDVYHIPTSLVRIYRIRMCVTPVFFHLFSSSFAIKVPTFDTFDIMRLKSEFCYHPVSLINPTCHHCSCISTVTYAICCFRSYDWNNLSLIFGCSRFYCYAVCISSSVVKNRIFPVR